MFSERFRNLEISLNALVIYFVCIFLFKFFYYGYRSSNFGYYISYLEHPLFSVSFILLPGLLYLSKKELNCTVKISLCTILAYIHFQLLFSFINYHYLWTQKVYWKYTQLYLFAIICFILFYKSLTYKIFKFLAVVLLISLLHFCMEWLDNFFIFQNLEVPVSNLNYLLTDFSTLILVHNRFF